MSVKVGVVGASGFAGIEIVRLVLRHPRFELVAATSSELSGRSLSSAYPALDGWTDLLFVPHDDESIDECDVVFLAVPHTAALASAPSLVERGCAVIDLSADFRLSDPQVYEAWYKVPHTRPDLLEKRAFGLPELFRADLEALAGVRATGAGVLVGCAGCYPTATSLAAAPALRAGLGAGGIVVVDAISGVSGAGRKATDKTHFCFAHEGASAYGVGNHRHIPEIEQILGIEGRLVFTPHLAPYSRGLLSTVTFEAGSRDIDQESLEAIYSDFYEGSRFVRFLGGSVQPSTASVTGTNAAQVSAVHDPRTNTIIATCAIDNIGKGAAGQAVQCANIVCGLPETAGLELVSTPV